MKLILYPLLMLIILSVFIQLMANTGVLDLTYSNSTSQSQSGNQTLNSEESELQQETTTALFDINMTTGIVALIIALVAVGVVAGIHVLGSGLSDYSVQLIHKSCIYYGLWGVFSALSFMAFLNIPIFGLVLWLGLTLIYSIGFFQTLNISSGSE